MVNTHNLYIYFKITIIINKYLKAINQLNSEIEFTIVVAKNEFIYHCTKHAFSKENMGLFHKSLCSK